MQNTYQEKISDLENTNNSINKKLEGGIKFKIKSKKGNNAIKKLNEILPARVVIVPFTIPRAYIFKKSNNDKPFNPGSFVNLSMFINDLYTLRDLIFPFTFI